MKGKASLIVTAVILIVLIAGATVLYKSMGEKYKVDSVTETTQQGQAETENKKTKAPDFTVTDGNGNPVKLSQKFGKPIILNFWASWCGPCKSEMPDFDKAYADLKDEVTFMIVNLTDGQRETVKTASEYVKTSGYSFPVYFDETGEAGTIYSVYSVPTTYFIDKDGFIIAQGKGALDMETLKKGIEMIR